MGGQTICLSKNSLVQVQGVSLICLTSSLLVIGLVFLLILTQYHNNREQNNKVKGNLMMAR